MEVEKTRTPVSEALEEFVRATMTAKLDTSAPNGVEATPAATEETEPFDEP
ncbi:MAG: hypothetical protein WBG19_01595 [Thermoplasmata archaeon]